jgi:hypothetical protein
MRKQSCKCCNSVAAQQRNKVIEAIGRGAPRRYFEGTPHYKPQHPEDSRLERYSNAETATARVQYAFYNVISDIGILGPSSVQSSIGGRGSASTSAAAIR